jgi:hypothetical protein
MTEYTDEQIADIIKNAKVVEQWIVCEDMLRRDLMHMVAQKVDAGLYDPFMKEVAASMVSMNLKRQTPAQKDKEPEPPFDEPDDKD